jgi:glycosyltransferase involved in cell wall biosynthesis
MVQLGMLKNRGVRAALFALERRLLNAADHVVVVTESFRERVIAKGVRPNRIDVVPNGVDLTLYHATDASSPVRTLGKASDEFLVGYLGTFGKGQGLEYVVRAAALLEKHRERIRFVLAGDGPELSTVKDEIARLGVTNVSLYPPIRRDETRAFYNSCDLCLVPLAPIPIFSETIPSKIFEIMACERPFVASVSGEGAAIVERSGAGILSNPGDPQGLADAILTARTLSREDREIMGRRARQYVSTHYDRVALADKYLEILGMVVERARTNDLARSSS